MKKHWGYTQNYYLGNTFFISECKFSPETDISFEEWNFQLVISDGPFSIIIDATLKQGELFIKNFGKQHILKALDIISWMETNAELIIQTVKQADKRG